MEGRFDKPEEKEEKKCEKIAFFAREHPTNSRRRETAVTKKKTYLEQHPFFFLSANMTDMKR